MLNVAIRLVSLATVLALWQIVGAQHRSGAVHHADRHRRGRGRNDRSGELWNYLAPSLVVLAIGLSLAAVVGIAIGLLLARFWVLDVALGVYITFLYSIPSVALVPLIVLWAGFETTAKVHHPVPVRLLPDGDQHLSGRQERRSRS